MPAGIASAIRAARSWSTSNVTRSRWLTPISVAPHSQGDLQLRLVVDLDEHVEAELDGERVELDQLDALEGGGDQQHGVGAHQPGVDDVERRHREVLAQHRQRRRGPGCLEVGRRAAEELLVGEHRQARRAAGGVLGGDAGRVEVGVEGALRRGAALDLGDHRQPRCSARGPGGTRAAAASGGPPRSARRADAHRPPPPRGGGRRCDRGR